MEGCGNYGVPLLDTTAGRVRIWYFPVVRTIGVEIRRLVPRVRAVLEEELHEAAVATVHRNLRAQSLVSLQSFCSSGAPRATVRGHTSAAALHCCAATPGGVR